VVRQFHAGEFHAKDWWRDATMTPDGRILAATRYNDDHRDRNVTMVWEAATGRELLHLPFNSYFLTLSDDGKRLVTDSDKGGGYLAEAWEIATGKRISKIDGYAAGKKQRMPRGLLSPDGKLLATTGTPSLLLWDVDSGKLVAAQEAVDPDSGDIVKAVAFSGNGQYVAVSSVGEVLKVWRLADVLKHSKLVDAPRQAKAL
jgi:WD40 repeat protein